MAYKFDAERRLQDLPAQVPDSRSTSLGELFGISDLVKAETERFRSKFPEYGSSSTSDKARMLYQWLIPEVQIQHRFGSGLGDELNVKGVRDPPFVTGESYHPGTLLEEGEGNTYALSVLGAAMSRQLGLKSSVVMIQQRDMVSSGFTVESEDAKILVNPLRRQFTSNQPFERLDDRAAYVLGDMWTRMEQGDLTKALDLSERVIDIDPSLGYIRLARGGFFKFLGREYDALDEYEAAAERPGYGEISRRLKATTYLGLDQPDNALGEFDQLIGSGSRNPDLYVDRASIHALMGDNEKAAQDYDQAINLEPKNPLYYAVRGYLFGRLGSYDAAFSDFDRSLQINPRQVEAYYNRGLTNKDMRRWAEAEADFTKAVELKPEDYEGYLNRGEAFSNQGRWVEAVKDFSEALARYDGRDKKVLYDIHTFRASSRYRLGDYEGAIEDFNHALEQGVNDSITYIGRGNCFAKKDDLRRALSDYDRGLALDPELDVAWLTKGQFHWSLGEREMAVDSYSEAIKRNPSSSMGYELRSRAYESMGRDDLARSDRQAIIDLGGTSPFP